MAANGRRSPPVHLKASHNEDRPAPIALPISGGSTSASGSNSAPAPGPGLLKAPGSIPKYKRKFFSNKAHHSVTMIPASAYQLSSITGNGGASRQLRKPRKVLWLLGVFVLLYWFGIRHGLGEERVLIPLGMSVPGGRKRTSHLRFDKAGMAILDTKSPGPREHPIYELMERAEDKWHGLIKNQSRTLDQAVREYKRRYILDPPAGFDAWWTFCENHNITIRDDYNQLMRDLLLHHALKPQEYVARVEKLSGQDFTYDFDVSTDGARASGHSAGRMRSDFMQDLVGGFAKELPEGFKLKVVVSEHDTGSQVLGQDQRQAAMELIEDGRHFSEEDLKFYENADRTEAFGWFKACDMTSPANARPGSENFTRFENQKAFIHDHLPTMDFCEYPEWKRLHGAMSIDYNHRSPSILKPILVLSKFPNDASFQMTPIEGFMNLTAEDLPYEGSWADKSDPRMFWRGTSTGGFDKWRDWRDSHRIRMHLHVNGPKKGSADDMKGHWSEEEQEVLMPDGKGGYRIERKKVELLGKAYADVKMSGSAAQCPTEELCKEINDNVDFGSRVSPEDSWQYKYALDIDGNGWSSRFHRLLSSASPVIKMTMFPEWHMGWLIPWYHYIPLKPDYSDLYDIMAFFAGPVDEEGKINEALGHDHLAKKIGEAGQLFALEHWSWEDMQAYTFRLLLELRRLHSLDRRAYTYRSDGK